MNVERVTLTLTDVEAKVAAEALEGVAAERTYRGVAARRALARIRSERNRRFGELDVLARARTRRPEVDG